MREIESELWKILVPVADNTGQEFPVEHHHTWDEEVRTITGGLTINRTARGQWHDGEGNLYEERVIPVEVACTEEEARQIMELTLRHYGQVAVMAFRISDKALILESDLS